jgi:coproporphyrinogen III oxidase-like Fe-S oxidoreductase
MFTGSLPRKRESIMDDHMMTDPDEAIASEATESKALPGLYVHIPFCIRKCGYCSFYSLTDLSLIPAFLDALRREAALYQDWIAGRCFDTLYLGGGTPSVLAAADLERLIGDLGEAFTIASGTEITVEANPGDITAGWLTALHRAGVNRLNLGCQSFDDKTLAQLGRRHTAQEALRTFALAREAGFTNLGLDLIYGLPLPADEARARESSFFNRIKDSHLSGNDREGLLFKGHEAVPAAMDRWLASLETAVRLAPEHLSCYELSVEAGTPLAGTMRREGLRLPDEAQRARSFHDTSAFLTQAGYLHYEVSNFARSEPFRARHNAKYWDHTPYLGLGPAAHSFDGRTRCWNHQSVEAYLVDLAIGSLPEAGSERLSDEQLRLEALFLGFRTREGIDLMRLRKRHGRDLLTEKAAMIEKLVAEGLLEIRSGRLRPTTAGLAVADSLALI